VKTSPASVIRYRSCSLSSAQRWYTRIYVGTQRPHAVVAFTHELPAGIGLEAVKTALFEMMIRHDCLRTVFIERDGELSQRTAEQSEFALEAERCDLISGVVRGIRVTGDIRTAREEAARQVEQLSSTGLPVTDIPLIRLVAVQVETYGGDQLVLAAVAHHFIFDGPSIAPFNSELVALASRSGHVLAPPSSYRDFTHWSLSYESREEGLRDSAHWASEVRQIGQGCHLQHAPDFSTEVAGQYRITLPATLCAATRVLAKRLRVFDFAVRLTALIAICHSIYDREDVSILMPFDMRIKYPVTAKIGMFINFVPVWHTLSGAETAAGCVTSTAEQVARTLTHGALALDRIAALSVEDGYRTRFPFTGALVNSEKVAYHDKPAVSRPSLETAGRRVAFDFQIYFTDSKDRTDVTLQYNSTVSDPPNWEKTLEDYVDALRHISTLPDVRFSHLVGQG